LQCVHDKIFLHSGLFHWHIVVINQSSVVHLNQAARPIRHKTTTDVDELTTLWWAGRPDRATPSDSGLGTASDVNSHDDSIAVEGDKLVIRPQSMPVAAATAEPPPSNRVR